MKQTLRIIVISALASAAAIKAVPALSEPLGAIDVRVVRTADLDLSSARGRALLEHRLVIAANEVCGNAADVDVAGRNAVRACHTDVLAKARAKGRELANMGSVMAVAAR